MPVHVDWLKKSKNDKEKADFEQLLRNSTITLSKLQELIIEKQDTTYTRERAVTTYDSPGWEYKQAHINGYLEGLDYVLNLLKFLNHLYKGISMAREK